LISGAKKRRIRHDSSDSDLSPVRKSDPSATVDIRKSRHDSSDSDLSPERKPTSLSLDTRKRMRHDSSDSDLSPIRRGVNTEFENATQLDSNSKLVASESDKRKKFAIIPKNEKEVSKIAGLKTSSELNKELYEQKRKEKDALDRMDSNFTGQFAETVYRDDKGRILSPKEYNAYMLQKRQKQREDARDYVKITQEQIPWARGMVQINQEKEIKQQMLKERDAPFARYVNDKELEQSRLDELRAEDPMAEYMEKKRRRKEEKRRRKEEKRKKKHKNRESTSSDSVSLQATTTPSVYKGSFPPNRFGIRPGHRWDGVNRSNGFESRLLAMMARKKQQSP
jgi:pre-mRNA-splicing factor CWC26